MLEFEGCDIHDLAFPSRACGTLVFLPVLDDLVDKAMVMECHRDDDQS